MDEVAFGRYRLLSVIGVGGMGKVYKAHDTATNRIVAVKLLPPDLAQDDTFVRRFRREAEVAAQLNNPHVVPIHNYGEIDGQLYVDMRLIEGRELAQVLAAGPLDPERAVRIIEETAKALHAAHKVGLVHRDVKPSNILLDEDDFAYLIDFGIARGADQTKLTSTGATIGTWAYMAPERLSEREVDARADIYALACVLYECLTGNKPFPGDTAESQVLAHLMAPVPRPSSTRPELSEQFDPVIEKGMAKDPDERYATTVELARDARDAVTVSIPRPQPAPPASPPAVPGDRRTVLTRWLSEFPPLRALDSSSGNLRPQVSSFIGRASEVVEVQAVLRAHRLVTLTGVGGMGKTRLAVEVAAQLADEFPDGVWVFELASVNDSAAVPDAVASVLNIAEQPGKSLADSVATAQGGRVRLLVFDNCEHVLDAAADLVEAILAHSTTVKILATSRQGLGLVDEQLWQVPSLDLAAGIDSAAVTLFVERARSVAPGFSLAKADEASAVVEICRRLDGMPLAIELAASRMASMSAIEVRDRLDHRFRLLVGSTRGLERHQTLRHAVAWSYDLLDDKEKALLDRCSVFANGFDLESACAVAGLGEVDDYAILDLLDAVVRKSLVVADQSLGRTRFSMLETIRQFAEEQLAANGAATEARTAHARYFAGREAAVLALWDSPRQREAYTWFTVELANLRTAFRWAADHGDLDVAAAIATYAAFLGLWVDNYEPIAWAEALIEPARAVDHPRLAFLYVMASQCYMPGRIEAAVRYSDAAQLVIGSGRDEVPFGIEALLGSAYVAIGQPDRWVEWCRAQLVRGRDTHSLTRACLVVALAVAGCGEEARAAADGLIDAAEATRNPCALSLALFAHGRAFRDADPAGALDALRRGLVIAQDSGNRDNETRLAHNLSRLEAEHGDPLAALDYVTLVIRTRLDAGNTAMIRNPLAVLAAFFDRLGRYEPAATIAGFAAGPLTRTNVPDINTAIAHLRDVLGDLVYDSLAHKGATMTTAAMATYAYDQIDQARAELKDVSK